MPVFIVKYFIKIKKKIKKTKLKYTKKKKK